MVKQLIVAVMSLLIHNTPEAIHHIRAILDFTMLAQYVLHDIKMLRYIEYKLYKPEKIKLVFELHRPINSKLYWPIFNFPKFQAICHFIECIWGSGGAVNYDIAYSKRGHKYLFKAF